MVRWPFFPLLLPRMDSRKQKFKSKAQWNNTAHLLDFSQVLTICDAGQDVEQLELVDFAGGGGAGMQNGTATLKTFGSFLESCTYTFVSQQSYPRRFTLKKWKLIFKPKPVHRIIWANSENTPNVLGRGNGYTNYFHAVEHYSPVKGNKLLIHTTWRNLKSITLGERRRA